MTLASAAARQIVDAAALYKRGDSDKDAASKVVAAAGKLRAWRAAGPQTQARLASAVEASALESLVALSGAGGADGSGQSAASVTRSPALAARASERIAERLSAGGDTAQQLQLEQYARLLRAVTANSSHDDLFAVGAPRPSAGAGCGQVRCRLAAAQEPAAGARPRPALRGWTTLAPRAG
jgi:hypothetical protein